MTRQINTKDAINEAIRLEMESDDSVFIMGEDICGGAGRNHETALDALGGAYGVTKGLATQFSRKRVVDTPISETAFLGMGIGAAFAGLRPIIEIMYVDFIGVCFDQLFNQAAKMCYMYGGKTKIPFVLRMPVGAGLRSGAEHSQTLYPLFTSIPGLKVVAPSDAYDAKGLLIQSIRDNDPVVFLEHKRTYMTECEVPEESYALPLGKAVVKREGSDVTLIAIQKMVEHALSASAILEAEEGINVEVIDPRTLSPLDTETILKSALKTGRVVIADESYPRCGMAADFSAIITEELFTDLKSPVIRVIPPHTPVPFSGPLEDEWVPNENKIVAGIKKSLEY